MKKVLVLCTGNSCRSQMAHGYLQKFAKDKAEIYSAGVEMHGVNPLAVQFMKEDGVDISSHTSNHVDEYRNMNFDYVITVCDYANETCPHINSKAARFHHDFPDPSRVKGTEEEVAAAFRRTRELIKNYCEEFVKNYLAVE